MNQPERPAARGTELEADDALNTAVPRVYVASLADYNDGRLHGRWLDATAQATELLSGVHQILASSPISGAEEYAIHDYDNFYGLKLGEYESLATIVRVARGLKRHGRAFAAWAHVIGTEDADERSFQAHHLGSFKSLDAFAAEYALDLGAEDLFTGVPPSLEPYCHFDAEALVRDAVLSGELAVHESRDQEGRVEQVDVFVVPGAG